MARTKQTKRKVDRWERRRQDSSAHKNGHLNQWKTDDMKNALKEHHTPTPAGEVRLSIRALSKKYKIPYATLYKRISGEVKGTGHKSGGRRVPKVFTAGKSVDSIDSLGCQVISSQE